jgi:hypothetical protein
MPIFHGPPEKDGCLLARDALKVKSGFDRGETGLGRWVDACRLESKFPARERPTPL